MQQLLTWNRARASLPREQLDNVDLRALLEEVAVELSPLIAARHQSFQLEAAPCPWHGPAWMVHEIVVNLLHNAMRYTPDGGALEMQLLQRDGWIELSVQDDGPGLSAQMERDLFVPFVTSDTAGRGAGLGLAICRDLAAACHGELRVRNRLVAGQVCGLQATLILPAGTGQATGSKSPP